MQYKCKCQNVVLLLIFLSACQIAGFTYEVLLEHRKSYFRINGILLCIFLHLLCFSHCVK